MSIDVQTVKRLAELSRLAVAPAEEAALATELSGLLSRLEILAAADTAGVEPLYSLMFGEIPGDRPDEPRPSGLTEELLSQAPDRLGDFFAVPKIL